MTDMLHIGMDDGSLWVLPTGFVANDYARSISDKFDGTTSERREYRESLEAEMLADDAALLDWALNNMIWSDIKRYARMAIISPSPDYDGMYGRAQLSIVHTEAQDGEHYLDKGVHSP